MSTGQPSPSGKPFFPPSFYERIPRTLWQSVAEVQKRTGITARVSLPTFELLRDFPHLSRAPALLDIWPEEKSIMVWVQSPDIPPHFLAHELIHLRRNILESVPRLMPLPHAAERELVFGMENDLEHLFIIPEEISLFPEAEAHWAAGYRGIVARAGADPLDWFRHWTVINTTLPRQAGLIEDAAARLRALGLIEEAEAFRSAVVQAMPDKRRMLDVALSCFHELARDTAIHRYAAEDGTLTVIV